MKKNTAALRLQRILDIKDGKPMPNRTKKSQFNIDAEANRPTGTRCYQRTERGNMLSQRQMAILRRVSQYHSYPLEVLVHMIPSKKFLDSNQNV